MTPPPPTPDRRDDSLIASERALSIVFGLVDMFVRGEGRHRPTELAQFEALMLHFLTKIDPFSRAVVAQKLAPCASLPTSILELLAFDRDEVAEPVLMSAPLLPPQIIEAILQSGSAALRACLDRRHTQPEAKATTARALSEPSVLVAEAPKAEVAHEPEAQRPPHGGLASSSQAFFDASPTDRQATLRHLSEVSEGEVPAPMSRDRLEALLRLLTLRDHDGVAQILTDVLVLPLPLTRRMIDDPHGEALVIAGRVMGLEEAQFLRLVLLANPQVGRVVDRVYRLRALYRQVSPQAAVKLVTSWRGSKSGQPRFVAFDNRRGTGIRHVLSTPAATNEPGMANRASGRQ